MAEGYDFIINDHAIAQTLRPATRRTFLEPSVPSPAVRLCQNVESLQAHLATRTGSDPLYQLLGHRIDSARDGFGAPLFVPADATRPSRRRQSVLLMSSYGSSYGMLRRNGRLLYLADIVNRREAMIGESLRRVNQRKLLDGMAQVETLHRTPDRAAIMRPAGIATVP